MKVPERIINLIKDIEKTGSALSDMESKLYSFLDDNIIDAESEHYDIALEFLFHSHDGMELIKLLKKE